MAQNQIERCIDNIYEFVENCKASTFSPNKVVIPKDELYDLLDELKLRTPDEIKRYQKIIANRDSIIAQAEEKAEQIIEEAKAKAKQLVSEHEIMQQAYARANELVSAAGSEADEMLTSANSDADQIRTGALSYANDIMTDMEKILQEAYETTRTRAENLVAALKENFEVVSENRKELDVQLNPQEAAAAYDNPIATVSEDGEFDFGENTFLDNNEE